MPLPGPAPDRYKDVDCRNFTTVGRMTRAEMLEMAELSQARGDAEARDRWKAEAVQNARDEEIKSEAARFKRMAEPKLMPPSGPILAPMTAEWGGDIEFKELQDKYCKAQAASDAGQGLGSQTFELEAAAATARAALVAREETIKGELVEQGAWSESDDRRVEAEKSLNEKSQKIAGFFG